jgi:DNA-binding transcriptional LysR family regulator
MDTLFLERFRRILCEIEAAEPELSQIQGAPRGKLRVLMMLTAFMSDRRSNLISTSPTGWSM